MKTKNGYEANDKRFGKYFHDLNGLSKPISRCNYLEETKLFQKNLLKKWNEIILKLL